jgi:hypothetical protein
MSEKATMDEFNGIVAEVATSLLTQVKDNLQKNNWKVAFLDAREPPKGGSGISKFRVELQDGTVIRTFKASGVTIGRFWDAFDIRDALFPKKWYGFTLTIFPDGKHNTEFNYDPDCVNDPDFYDVDEDLKIKAGLDKPKKKLK